MKQWKPANNGSGKYMWLLIKDGDAPVDERFHFNEQGRIIRYKSRESAQRAADRLNAEEAQDLRDQLKARLGELKRIYGNGK
jgi:hypothetical protein